MKITDIANNEKYAPPSGDSAGFFSMKEPGEYQIRIVSGFFPFDRAPFRPGGTQGRSYACHMIDRKDGEFKVYTMQSSIMKQLIELSKDEDYKFEDYPHYDIKIVKKKTGPEVMNVEYQILPKPALSLTQEELDAVTKLANIGKVGLTLAKKEQAKIALQMEAAPQPQEETLPTVNVDDDVPPPADEPPMPTEPNEGDVKVEDIPF